MTDLRIFIGFDQKEAVAYHTLCQSIIELSSVPVSIVPLKQSLLPKYRRERDLKQSNEFSYTRFLVPSLCDYEGWAVYMDPDMLFRVDPKDLWELRDDTKSLQVVKHDYMPKTRVKYLGATQYAYPRKNWSSLILYNCQKCRDLTPATVNRNSPKWLHRFEWLEDNQIGELGKEWNHLVGEYDYNPDAKIVHFTIGSPCFRDYMNCDYSDEWFDVCGRMQHADQYEENNQATGT